MLERQRTETQADNTQNLYKLDFCPPPKKYHNTQFNRKQMQCTTKQEMVTSFANDEQR